jgi:5S rRNA maturation endonuclease (ribonuclease M5)
MYFRGRRYSVGIDDLNTLKHKGTDILIIEKEGIAEQLRHLAADFGIALIHGRGFLTEYASELSALANKEGGNIAILTDFDDSGITIALQMPNVPRIGIDFDTLEELGISDKLEELEEMYKPDKHLTYIKNEHPEIRNLG